MACASTDCAATNLTPPCPCTAHNRNACVAAPFSASQVSTVVWVVASASAFAHAFYWLFFSAEKTVNRTTRIVALCFSILFGPLYWVFWAGIHSRDL